MPLFTSTENSAAAASLQAQVAVLDRMLDAYDHVKRFGIDHTFVDLYNQHGELNHFCNTQFPSCEDMYFENGDYSYLSSKFIAAMEDGQFSIWAGIKSSASKIVDRIKNAFRQEDAKDIGATITQAIRELKAAHGASELVSCSGTAARVLADATYVKTMMSAMAQLKQKTAIISRLINKLAHYATESIATSQINTPYEIPYSPISDSTAENIYKTVIDTNKAIDEYKVISKKVQADFGKTARDKSRSIQLRVSDMITRASQFSTTASRLFDQLGYISDDISEEASSVEMIAHGIPLSKQYRFLLTGKACTKIISGVNFIASDIEKLQKTLTNSMKSIEGALMKAAGLKTKS